MSDLNQAYGYIQDFKTGSLRDRIADLEARIRNTPSQSVQDFLARQSVDVSTLLAALMLKRATGQIDEIVHALGILLSLPQILDPNEVVEYVSLAAGNTGRPFDLETNQRIAEFKFIEWKGGSETIRQNQLFKDFYLLAEYPTDKQRFLYVLETREPLKFMNGGRSLKSVMSRGLKLWGEFQVAYGARFSRVHEYYAYRRDTVNIVDLGAIVPWFRGQATTPGVTAKS